MNSLIAHLYISKDKSISEARAQHFRKQKQLDRGVRALLLYLCHRRDKKQKATYAVDFVGNMQDRAGINQVFQALKKQVKIAKKKLEAAENHHEFRSIIIVFEALKANKVRQDHLNQARQAI